MNDTILADEVTHMGYTVIQPDLAGLDIAIVVLFRFKDEDVKFFIRQLLPVLRLECLALDADLVPDLSDISLKIIVVQTLAG